MKFENGSFFLLMFGYLTRTGISVEYSSRWLSRYEDGYCLSQVERQSTVNSADECFLTCLIGISACYGVSFNTATGQCKISGSSDIEACLDSNLMVFVSVEALPVTTTSTSTSTSTTSTTTTANPTTTTTTAVTTTTTTQSTTAAGNSPSYPAINIDRVHRASSSATSGDNYWRKANVADGNYTDDGFCADWDGNEEPYIILDLGSSLQNTVKQVLLFPLQPLTDWADELSDLVIELADSISAFTNQAGEHTCATTSGPAISDPYLVTCNSQYYERFLKIGRPNATITEHLCMVEIEVYG